MAFIRNPRLSSLRSSLLSSDLSSGGVLQGGFFGRYFCGCSSNVSLGERVSDLIEAEKQVSDTKDQIFADEIEKIRKEFNAAKQRFSNIPEALKQMPKMNPTGLYVNKNLRLDNIQVYGFDYDYTLAHYTSNLQSLIYNLAKEHLVNEFKYPESCLAFKYDPTFPIRGLYYDKSKGCLLKLDFFGSIELEGCYYGRQKVDVENLLLY